MLPMNYPIVHFEIPADDTERAIAFYKNTFGWEINKFDMPSDGATEGHDYYGVRTSPVDEKNMPMKPGAINGGLMKRKMPDQPFMNYIQADSIDDVLKTIVENGGMVAMPKTEIAPNMGWIAAFKDTEGNLMGLHEMPEEAKAQMA